MRALWAPLSLAAARARRRPGRWLLPALGVALAAAFAGAVVAEGTIAADQSARSVLSRLDTGAARSAGHLAGRRHRFREPPRARAAQRPRPVAPDRGRAAQPGAAEWHARAPGRDRVAEPVAGTRIAPGAGRLSPEQLPSADRGSVPRRTLTTDGAKLSILGATQLRSAVPLGFAAAAGANEHPPLALTADVAGLDGARRPGRDLPLPQLAGAAADQRAAQLAARLASRPDPERPGGVVVERQQLHAERPVRRDRPGQDAGRRGAQPAAARRGRRAGGVRAVHRARRGRAARRSARRLRTAAHGRCPQRTVRSVRDRRVGLAVRDRGDRRRLRRSRRRGRARPRRGRPRGWGPDPQPADPGWAARARGRVGRGDGSALAGADRGRRPAQPTSPRSRRPRR